MVKKGVNELAVCVDPGKTFVDQGKILRRIVVRRRERGIEAKRLRSDVCVKDRSVAHQFRRAGKQKGAKEQQAEQERNRSLHNFIILRENVIRVKPLQSIKQHGTYIF